MKNFRLGLATLACILPLAACDSPSMLKSSVVVTPGPTCFDGVKNGTEVDVDCGGHCTRCALGKTCTISNDCSTANCAEGTCGAPIPVAPAVAPTCTDGKKNGAETDIDCGGTCGACAMGKLCNASKECATGHCTFGSCQAPTCGDGEKNGTETDVDCGGASCVACNAGVTCAAATDCASGVCGSGRCSVPVCTDSAKNGTESDTDCGGTCGAKCTAGKKCGSGADCATGACASGSCVAATCMDGVKNANETGVDCGGGCAACSDWATCSGKSDCKSGKCESGHCAPPACNDGLKNGTESDVDCGGDACAPCAAGKVCAANRDCFADTCTANVCIAANVSFGGGTFHGCALRQGGRAMCFGFPGVGALGYGDSIRHGSNPPLSSATPYLNVGVGRTVKQLSVATTFTCALLDDNTVKCWGTNGWGNLGQGDTLQRGDTPATAASVIPPINLGTGRTAKSVAAGGNHVCAILDNDTVKCWGFNASGQLGTGTTITMGDNANEMGDFLPVVNLGTGRTAKAVSVGQQHSCAILDNDSVKCWGYGGSGGFGTGALTWTPSPASLGDAMLTARLGTGRTAKAISVGSAFTCVLLDNSTLKCFGSNSHGQLGQGDVLDRGGSALTTGDNLPPINLGTGRTVKAVAASNYASVCAILDNDSVKCWGLNSSGLLGQGDTVDRGTTAMSMGDGLLPINLGTGRTAVQLGVGQHHACALLDNNRFKCWGSNYGYYQLAIPDGNNRGDNPNEMGDFLPYLNF